MPWLPKHMMLTYQTPSHPHRTCSLPPLSHAAPFLTDFELYSLRLQLL